MRIIGIDPGMAIVGYCVMDIVSGIDSCNLITSGSIQTDKKKTSAERLYEIHQDISQLIEAYKPDVAAIEQIFFFKNAKTIMPVCEARGVIVMTFEKFSIPVYEYTPLVVKQTITGYGRAEKEDVKNMVQIILNNDNLPKLDDTTDAIAIALCHSRQCLCE